MVLVRAPSLHELANVLPHDEDSLARPSREIAMEFPVLWKTSINVIGNMIVVSAHW